MSGRHRTWILDDGRSDEVKELAAELGVGTHLLEDILTSLTRPGIDPRDNLPPPVFRRGIMKLEDLAAGMELSGTVLNVVCGVAKIKMDDIIRGVWPFMLAQLVVLALLMVPAFFVVVQQVFARRQRGDAAGAKTTPPAETSTASLTQ